VDALQIAGHRVEPSTLRIFADGQEVRLEAKAMQVLLYLAEQPGRVVSRDELERALWPGRVVTEDAVTNAVAKVRRAFDDDAHNPRVIETVTKSGYRLIAGVSPIDVAPAPHGGLSGSKPSLPRSARRMLRHWTMGAVSVLLILAFGGWLLGRDAPSPERTAALSAKSAVAVLPFDNLGETPEQDYFANGITADLITDLSKLEDLLVIAPGSVFAYKDSDEGPREISAALNVDYVVVGSVQRLGDQLRINVQLIEAAVERAVWGERYAGGMDAVFDVQDQVAAGVIRALKVELAPAERALLARRPTASVLAYDHYLRGLELHGRRSKEENLAARDQFEKAAELDPTFARAYAGLALTHSRDAIDGWTSSPSASLALAADLAERAAHMDPTLAQVHFVTGQVDLFRRRHVEAIQAAERAIQADPNYADAYALRAWTLVYAGRSEEAITALERAMRLNPRPPASYLEILGEIRFAQARYGESAATFQRVLDLNPDYTRARMWSAAALARAGAWDQAEWEAAEVLVSVPDFALARLEFAFPFKDPRALDTLLDGLKKAGLPD